MGLRLLVTGASSFVGAHFCRRAARRHQVFALYHRTPVRLNRVTPVRCDLRHNATLQRLEALRVDAVVHLAFKVKGLAPGSPHEALNRRMMDVAIALGKPIAYGSTTAVHWPQETTYAALRREDEARLAASGLPWASLRPCAPYGPRLIEHQPRHKESFHTLAELVQRAPLVPVPGSGQALRQPIHVHDFCDAMLALLESGLPSRAFDAGGAEAMTFDAIVATIAEAAGRPGRVLHLPTSLLAKIAPFTKNMDAEMLSVADTDDAADPGPLAAASGQSFRPFREGAGDLLR